jgi:hypothetical protein
MGFQWVLARSHGDAARFLVFNAEYAFDLSHVQLLPGDDPSVISTNGRRILQALREPRSPVTGGPEPAGFVLLANRIDISSALSAAASSASSAPQIVQPSGLVMKVTLGGRRVFHRFSAFNPDRRIDSHTGSFVPGTYGVSESEVPLVPSGLAAVGRFALPNLLPASHHFYVDAGAGTVVAFGTVAPAFGQAGGGVEAYFPAGAVNQQNPRKSPSRLPDE